MNDGLWLFPDFSRVRAALATEYTDLEEIASRVTHSVFRARRLSGDDSWPCALTVALGSRGEAIAPSERLEHIATVTRRVKHPNVMHMNQPRTVGGYWTCEMPLLSGHTLEHVLSEGRLPYEQALPILRDVAAALQAAHAVGVAHGALRPSCLHIGTDGRCVVTGFTLGLGGGKDRPERLTSYEAPEQRRKMRVDGHVDQYALAVIAYELLSGAPRAIVDAAGVVEILPISIPVGRPLAPGVPEHATVAIRKATAKDPAARFDSIAEFIDAFTLGAAANPKPVQRAVQETKPKQRRSYASTIVLVGMMLLSTAIVFAPQGTTQVIIRSGEGVARWWRSWRAVGVPRVPRDDAPLVVQNSGGDAKSGAKTTKGGTARGERSGVQQEPDRRGTSRRSASTTSSSSELAPAPASARSPDRRETARSIAALNAAGVAATPQHGILVVVTDRGRPVVRINNLPRGRAPLALRLRPGTYRITLLTRVGFQPRDMQVTVAAGDTAYAEFEAPDGAFPDDTLASLGLFSTRSSAGKYIKPSTNGVAAGT